MEAGFDRALADSEQSVSVETYLRNLEEAVEAGVSGAPFYIVDEQRFWGQDRIADPYLHLQGKL